MNAHIDAAAKYVTPAVAGRVTGRSRKTLNRWAEAGLIQHYRSPTGRYYYDVSEFVSRLPSERRPEARSHV